MGSIAVTNIYKASAQWEVTKYLQNHLVVTDTVEGKGTHIYSSIYRSIEARCLRIHILAYSQAEMVTSAT